MYDALAVHASRVLREGGSLLCYVGHFAISTVIQKMESLEIERDHYKLVYEYVFAKLCEYISEEEKQYIMAMTGYNYDSGI